MKNSCLLLLETSLIRAVRVSQNVKVKRQKTKTIKRSVELMGAAESGYNYL